MKLAGRRILVTGACGFIGSHLAERLVNEGASVRAFVRYDSLNSGGCLQYSPLALRQAMEIVHADLKDPYSVYRSMKGIDIVLHLGALISIPYSYQSPMDFVQANILGTMHILQAGLEVGVQHIIIASTSEVYGTAQFTPITEKHPLVGQSPYAASKIAAEKMAESFSCSYRLPVTILRPFNTFGERQSARAFIPNVIAQALYRGRIFVGSLDPQRDLNYVSDIVDGFIRACHIPQPSGEVYNIGSGKMRSMRQVIDEILELLRMDCPVDEEPRRMRPAESEVWCLQASSEKARQALGWGPSCDFRQGLQNTIEFIRAHPEVYADWVYPL